MHELSVHADLLSIRDIGPWLRDVASEAVAPDALESFAMRCELAVQELAVNIVTHGFEARVSDEVINICTAPGKIIIDA